MRSLLLNSVRARAHLLRGLTPGALTSVRSALDMSCIAGLLLPLLLLAAPSRKKLANTSSFNYPLHADGQYRYGDIRLVGGSYQWEGRVEIYMSEIWGTITDSDWTNNDAQVVCRKLGHFKPGIISQCTSVLI